MYQNLLSLFIFFSHFQIFPNAFAANILDAVSIFAKTAFHQEGQGEAGNLSRIDLAQCQ